MKNSFTLILASLAIAFSSAIAYGQQPTITYDEATNKVRVMGTDDHDVIIVHDGQLGGNGPGVGVLSFDADLFEKPPSAFASPIDPELATQTVAMELPHFASVDVFCKDGNDVVLMVGDFHGRVFGGSGNDEVKGDTLGNVFYGHDGDDTFEGSAFTDIVIAGPGDDEIDCGAGNDIVLAGEGNDDVDGGDGIDTIYGEEGEDRLRGGRGSDTLDGGPGDDDLYGEEGLDALVDGPGEDLLDGGYDGFADTLILRDDGEKDKVIARYVVAENTRGIAGIEKVFGGAVVESEQSSIVFSLIREVVEKERVFGGDENDTLKDKEVEIED